MVITILVKSLRSIFDFKMKEEKNKTKKKTT